ncbi:hypothetical protein G7Z17_g4540 [Cylindrodendrum hubeiense]|uniref:Uncharacterized protein n=1 Tax=Cylindrodendrum hubeiense TaxID=595255 RepID=A0A9P5HIW2_9HYPO|nr:hypothetical protein G7Z17_g4540 [Cylindrodendrum hubeiense]
MHSSVPARGKTLAAASDTFSKTTASREKARHVTRAGAARGAGALGAVGTGAGATVARQRPPSPHSTNLICLISPARVAKDCVLHGVDGRADTGQTG